MLHCFDTANVGLYGLAVLLIKTIDPVAFDELKRQPKEKFQSYFPRKDAKADIDRKFGLFQNSCRWHWRFGTHRGQELSFAIRSLRTARAKPPDAKIRRSALDFASR